MVLGNPCVKAIRGEGCDPRVKNVCCVGGQLFTLDFKTHFIESIFSLKRLL